MILNLVRTSIMKKTRITITHLVDKTKHHFLVENPDMLASSEVERIKKEMGIEMLYVNRRFYK